MGNTFTQGGATYVCSQCRRRTRYTGAQSLGSTLCAQCWDLAGLENEVSDGFYSSNEARRRAEVLIAEVELRGGSANSWRTTFGLEVK